MKTACCIFSYGITKGMKSYGPIGTLKRNKQSKELILLQIENLRRIFGNTDIYIVTGFGEDKIMQIVGEKKYIKYIRNDSYSSKNYGHAVKLILNNAADVLDNYHGIFFTDANIIFNRILNKKKNISWVVTKKHIQNKTTKNEDYIGLNIKEKNIDHLFYNIGDFRWCNSVYLTTKDIKSIMSNTEEYYDNMFMFEVINRSIEQNRIRILNNTLESNADVTEIKGFKDKKKIK